MRSKVLLVSNVLASVYAAILLWNIGGGIIAAGGFDYIIDSVNILNTVLKILGTGAMPVIVIYIAAGLFIAHILLFALGAIFGWCGYAACKSGMAKAAAVFFLLGTIAFPIYLVFGLPIMIIAFVGSSMQKKLNSTASAE